MTTSDWNTDIVNSRIRDASGRKRYAAGSPDAYEISVYSRCLPKDSHIGVVLGMTPELRNMAAGLCNLLISIDHNETSISTYKDWLPPSLASKEYIVQSDWNDLAKVLPEPADFILGDGIFGNVVPIANYSKLLELMRSVLSRQGCFVTRQCLMPDSVLENPGQRQKLLEQYRNQALGEAGFGLSMRLYGYADIAYDPSTSLLDNKIVFAAIDDDLKSGVLRLPEYQIIRRYFFQGINSLPTMGNWEKILEANNFNFKRQLYDGEYWYQYYPIYRCQPT